MAHINVTNRPEFAAYLNMALHNCYEILKHIITITSSNGNCKKIVNDGIVIKQLDQDGIKDACILDVDYIPQEYEKQAKLKKLFIQYFPMLDPILKKDKMMLIAMEEEEKKQKGESDNYGRQENSQYLNFESLYPYTLSDIVECLKNVFTVLIYYRDMASHIVFNDKRSSDIDFAKIEHNLVHQLHFAMTVASRIVKTRFSLKNELSFFVDNNTDRRYQQTCDENGILPINKNFSHSVFFKDDLVEGGNVYNCLSERGLVYLTCMFLEKKYSKLFIGEFADFYKICSYEKKGVKADLKDKMRWLLEIYVLYRSRIPHSKLDSTKMSVANAMDMLNEIKKCPNALFDVISKEDQESFEVESYTGERVLLKRHGERFAPMVLRWLDDKKVFPTLRFNVKYGKYHYVFCPNKKCADGIERVRTIVKDLNGFGRLTEVENRRKGKENVWPESSNVWNGSSIIRPFSNYQLDTPDMKPYITDMHTCYLIDNDKIGLYDGNYMPDIKDNNVVENKAPHYWLSFYDLPGMAFYSYLYENLNEEERTKYDAPQEVVYSYGVLYKALFEDLLNGSLLLCKGDGAKLAVKEKYGLDWGNIPKKIRYLLDDNKNRIDFWGNYANSIANEIDITNKRKDRLKKDAKFITSDDNKMGKDGYMEFRPGMIADYLVHDIVKYQPYKLPSDKPTGLNYTIMQSALATFSHPDMLDELKRIFVSLGLIGEGDTCHPFLDNVLRAEPINVLQFYELYLNEKISFLETFRYEGEGGKPGKIKRKMVTKAPFINPYRSKWTFKDKDNYKELAKHYLSMPIILPKSLYENPIRKVLIGEYGKELAAVLPAEGVCCNTSFMIQQYFKLVKQDDCPRYYYYEHIYKDLNKILGKEYTERELDSLVRTDVDKIALEKYPEYSSKNKNKKNLKSKDEYKDSYWEKYTQAKTNLKNTEQAIRRSKTQDILLFLLAQNVLVAEGVEAKNFLLKNVGKKGDGVNEVDILSKPVSVKFKFRVADHEFVVIYEDIPIKDWSRMLSLLYDWRVQNPDHSVLIQLANEVQNNDNIIMKYNCQENAYYLNYKDLAEELRSYDQNRVQMFTKILKFESDLISVIKENPQKREKVETKKMGFPKLLDLYLDRRKKGPKTKQGEALKEIRNALSHNQYPLFNALKTNNEIGVEQVEISIPGIIDRMKDSFDKNSDEFIKKDVDNL